jgi:hypothetical protein
VHVKEAHAGFAAIFFERFKLQARVGVDDGQRAIFGGDRVVHYSEREIGAADLAALGTQASEGLRGRAFVDEVAVNIYERGIGGLFVDNVAVPNFLVESFRSAHSGVGWILALWKGSRRTVEVEGSPHNRKRKNWGVFVKEYASC